MGGSECEGTLCLKTGEACTEAGGQRLAHKIPDRLRFIRIVNQPRDKKLMALIKLNWNRLESVDKPEDLYNLRDLNWVDNMLVATNVYLGTARLSDSRWETLVSDETGNSLRDGAGIQMVLPGWEGALVAVASDGKVFQLQMAEKTWRLLSGPSKIYKAKWPLVAFDSVRKLLVVWGSQKAEGRKDDCLCFDGKVWCSPKKSAPAATADLGIDADAAFCLFFDPTLKCVVRVGVTEAAYFDGQSWRSVPLEGGEHLDTWDRRVCVDLASKCVFSVHRFKATMSVAQLTCTADRVIAIKRATFESPIERKSTDAGGNVAFDLGIYDPVSRRLLAFDEKNMSQFSADLTCLVT